jgi:murein L,D-transpeptidase YafK
MVGGELYYQRMPRLIAIAMLLLPAIEAAGQAPAWLIRLPETTPTVYVAETSTSTLYRFDRDGDAVRLDGQDYMSIGKGGDAKERAGDQRTPLGIYFVTDELDTTRLHEKYGPLAFPLDYPNAWDRRQGRTGDGIWVHGVDRNGGKRPPLDTDGCIALPNDRLLALADSFEPNVTPVLIGRQVRFASASLVEEVRAELEAAVDRWAGALERGDMFAYLDAYDESFEHWGMNRDEWIAFSLQTAGQRTLSSVAVSELLLLGDPVEDGLYLGRFRLALVEEGGHTLAYTHRLYWRRSESGALKIVAEDSG